MGKKKAKKAEVAPTTPIAVHDARKELIKAMIEAAKEDVGTQIEAAFDAASEGNFVNVVAIMNDVRDKVIEVRVQAEDFISKTDAEKESHVEYDEEEKSSRKNRKRQYDAESDDDDEDA